MELYNAEEATKIRKILAHDIRMKKNPQTKERSLWNFEDFHGVMQVQTPAKTPARKFYQWRRQPRNRLYAASYVFKYFALNDFFKKKKKKAPTLTENLLKFNGTYLGRKQPFESFLKSGCAE